MIDLLLIVLPIFGLIAIGYAARWGGFLSERAGEGVMVTERMTQDLTQGSGGRRILSTTEVHDWKRYQTRVMSSANRVNLDFEDAAPQLVAGLTRAIAGIF